MVCPSRDGRFMAGSRHGDGMVRLETAGSWQARSMLTKCYIVGDLPEISFMLLHAEFQEGLLSEAHQSQMPVTSVKESNVCHGRGEAYYFGCLYNLQHKVYDNNLIKYNCWKEIAGELHAE